MSDQAVADVVAALGVLPEDIWLHGDDACDCTFQRIGLWKNPYLGQTLEVRMCCIWEELYKLFPQFVRTTNGYLNGDDEWEQDPLEWNGETDMPKALWYRHLARKEAITVAEARAKYAERDAERPRGVPRPVVEPEPQFDPIEGLMLIVAELTRKVEALEAR